MKGIVFNLLEEVVVADLGETLWEDLLSAAGSSGAYTSLGSYPDEDIERLVAAGANALKLSPPDVLRWFGRRAMPLLAKRYPAYFRGHRDTRQFVMSVNSIIHPEVRKLYSGARCPHFHFEQSADRLMIIYESPRKMCALAIGFIEGAADYFGETARVEHVRCSHKGDADCLFDIGFTAAPALNAA